MIDTSKPPMVHRIHIPRPYEPSFNTDIRRTFAREQARLARERLHGYTPDAACVRYVATRDDDNERMYAL